MFQIDLMKDKTIVITGGGSGLGFAMAQKLCSYGAKVLITSRNEDKLKEAVRLIKEGASGDADYAICDVRIPEQVEGVLATCVQKFGSPDVLINNAAGNFVSPTEMLSYNAFASIVDIVLKGTANCTMAFGKHWITERKRADVINIVTTYAWTGSGYVVPSASAKAGVLAMTRSLSVEWGKYNIRFNAIAPGPIPTKGAWDRLVPDELKDKFDLAKKNPMGRLGTPEELANLVTFLLSDMSRFINGEVITMDGGEWLQGGGEFNFLNGLSKSQWEGMVAGIKSKTKKG